MTQITDSGDKKKGKPPSHGEDNALQGYDAQYAIAAEFILGALKDSDFEGAILKDPRAEKVDDFQIIRTRRVDAYQVKWHIPPKPLTASEIKGSNKNPEIGLLRQLADGWKALRATYTEKVVWVHLYTTKTSGSELSDIPTTATSPRTLDEFLKAYWETELPSREASDKWQPFIDILQIASGLSVELFEQFRLHCKFDLNRRSLKDREEYDSTKRYYKDLEHLQYQLLKKAGQVKGVITLTRREILELAGWTERFEFKAQHEFPTPNFYVPINDTVERLEEALQKINQGYLALIGTPGSGKSTLLTRTLRYRKNIQVFRYYCFVPDDTALSRGEAYNFLHDLVLMLTKEGIRPWGHPMGDTIGQLRKIFEEQIQEIGNLWKEKEIRTIILIDGLDHIKRESNPEYSLLNELPQSSAIPEGCVFVLGTQRIDQIGLRTNLVQVLLEDSFNRIITMAPLERRAIREIIVKRLSGAEIREITFETIESRSAGHPLALNYILNRLHSTDPSQIDAILASIPEYADNIEREYEAYWEHLQSDVSLRRLLALLSRMRGTLDLNLILALASEETIGKLVATAKHYFIELPGNRWKFFHNSFRQFILDMTGRNAFGIDDLNAHRKYHQELAQLADGSDAPSIFKWERLYHTFNSGNYKSVLEIGTQEYFRDQFLSSRPSKLIFDDTKLVMMAAREHKSALSAIRVLLIESELSQRNTILEDHGIYNLLLKIGKPEEAIKHVLWEGQLLIDSEKALDFACNLADSGHLEVAREIFEVAEPLDRFSGSESGKVVSFDRKDILQVWVRAAIRFRPFDEIKKAINGLESRDEYPYQDSREATKNLREHLFFCLADAVIEVGERDEIEKLPSKLLDVIDEKILRRNIAYSVISSEVDSSWKDEELNYLLEINKSEKLPETMLLRIAGILLKEKKDIKSAKEIFGLLEAPKRVIDQDRSSFNFVPYIHRLRYYRLSTALGFTIEPTKAVPDSSEDHHKGSVLIERMVIRMANLWGRAWRGDVLESGMVINELLPALRLIENWDDRELRLAFSGKHKQFIEILINTASAYGDVVVKDLSRLLEKHWLDESTSKYWFNSLRRHASLSLFRAGCAKEELINRLNVLEPNLGDKDDVRDFLEGCTDHLVSWAELDLEKAYSYITLMIKTSFGLYHEKDPQIYSWVEWFQEILESNPEIAKKNFRIIAQGVATASAYGRGGQTHDASVSFLSVVAGCAPALAEKLKQIFWDKGVLNYLATLEAFLVAGFKEKSVPIDIPFAILTRLYLPYIHYFEKRVIQAFIDRLLTREGAKAVALLKNLIESVEREVSPHLCGRWWAELDEVLRSYSKVEILLEIVSERRLKQRAESNHTKGSVTLNNGKIIEEDTLLEQARSPERLLEILENIKSDNFYSWHQPIKNVLGQLTKVQAEKLFQALIKLGRVGRDVSSLILKLHEFGDRDQVEQYATNALKQSNPHGWSYSYDGGSRIEPYKILIKIDQKYSEKAFEHFVDDYLGGSSPYYLNTMLSDLIKVFWVNPPAEQIWEEIFGHFSRLREFENPAIELSDEFELNQFSPAGLTAELIRQITESYNMPQPEMREDAYKTLIHLYATLPEVREQIVQVIDDFLSKGKDSPLLGISLIRGLYDTNPDLLERFSTKLENFLKHDDMAIRFSAKKSLAHTKDDLSIKRKRTLPEFYKMTLPEFETLEFRLAGSMVEANSILPDTNDSLQIVGVAQEALEIIQRASGLSFRNLVERTAALMKRVLPIEDWNSGAEKKLSDKCKLLGIQTAYRRPRSLAAYIALGHLISELYDADLLDESDLRLLEPSLSCFDVVLYQKEPIANNLSPIQISIPNDFMQRLSEWIHKRPDNLTNVPVTSDGWPVLGFVTKADIPRWEYPSEHIFGGICSPHMEEKDLQKKPESIIPGTMMALWWLAEHYPFLPYLKTALQQSLLIRSESQRLEIGRVSWLALNPLIAQRLGWSFNNEGLFEWCDNTGKVMVKSEWWRTGRRYRHAPSEGVRAEGWIVKASPEGYDAIKSIALPAKWVCGIRKSLRKEQVDGETDNTWVFLHDLI